MITRYNYKWVKPVRISDSIKEDYELIKKIVPVSFNEDKSVKEYTEEISYKCTRSKWSDFVKSFDIGSVSDQVMSHLTKGTPLITAHTLPAGDYTHDAILKAAEFKRKLDESGLTIDELVSILNKKSDSSSIAVNDSDKKDEVIHNG